MPYIFFLSIFFLSALFLEFRFRIHLYRSLKERLIVTFFFFVVGVAWDTYAVTSKHWIFPGDGLIGYHIGVLPLEEYLFILIVPFWILTAYKVWDKKIK